jgi:hypothetical protein
MAKTVSLQGPGTSNPWRSLGDVTLDAITAQISTTKVLDEGTLYKVDGKPARVKFIELGQYKVLWQK